MDPSPSDDEDEQLKLAIAMSLQDAGGAKTHDPPDSEPRIEGPSSLLGLDRKAMEAERLARLKAKPQNSEPTNGTRKRKALSVEEEASNGARDHHDSAHVSATSSKRPKSLPQGTNAPLKFAGGKVLKTWCYGFERTGQDIKIEEVLDKHHLKLAVLSSFQWDMEWLFSKVNSTTKLVLIMQAKDEETRESYRQETRGNPNLRLCFPPMPGNVNCMHSKLMLLSFPRHLRIAIPTANLVSFDWGETGIMENSLFVIDLPRLRNGAQPDEANEPQFPKELIHFCQAMGLSADIIGSLSNFDFSDTGHLALVHSIGGEHRDQWDRTGYPGLGKAVQYIGAATSDEIDIDFVASSIGAINSDMVNMITNACHGDDGLKEYRERISKTRTKRVAVANTLEHQLRVYFPSSETVRQSKGGPNNAGTVCFQRRWYESPQFPTKILRDCRSVRPRLLMHNKMIFVKAKRRSNSSPTSTSGLHGSPSSATGPPQSQHLPSWLYVGSANFSESAWGRIVQDKGSKQPKLTCRNWECGVLVRCATDDMPIPMELNTPSISDSGKTPWFNAEA